MKLIGYSLISRDDNAEIAAASLLPHRFYVPGTVRVDMDRVGLETADGKYRLVERWRDETTVPEGQKRDGETTAFDGEKVVVSPVFAPMTAEEITERDARAIERERTRPVLKLLIVNRIIAAGKAARFKQALAAAPNGPERWNARDSIPAGHPGFRNLLTGIGLAPDTILAEGEPDEFA